MKLNDIKLNKISRKKKRLGRGNSSGSGNTSGKGNKGQKARTGSSIPRGFEGGQTKLTMKLPKVGGFKGKNIPNYIIKTSTINKYFKDNDTVSPEFLIKKGLVKKILKHQKIKILFDEKLSIKPIFKNVLLSSKIKQL